MFSKVTNALKSKPTFQKVVAQFDKAISDLDTLINEAQETYNKARGEIASAHDDCNREIGLAENRKFERVHHARIDEDNARQDINRAQRVRDNIAKLIEKDS